MKRFLCLFGRHAWHYAHCSHRWCKRCPKQQVWEWQYGGWVAPADPNLKRYHYGQSGSYKEAS